MILRNAIFASVIAIASSPMVAAAAPLTTVADRGASPTATSRADNPAQRYCIEDSVTGSRIRRVQCDTLSRWQSQGVDPRLMPRRK